MREFVVCCANVIVHAEGVQGNLILRKKAFRILRMFFGEVRLGGFW